MAGGAKGGQPSQAQLAQANMAARQIIIDGALKRTQLLSSQVVDIQTVNTINIPPRNVGIIIGFLVNVRCNIAVGAMGTVLTLTPFGAANLVKQFRYDDLNNNTRIQTPGWHINNINSVRGGLPYLAVDAMANLGGFPYPVSYGSWYPSLVMADDSIAAGANSDVNMTYFVPLAYSDQDLRGAVFANVIQATQNLQLQLNADAIGARSLSNWANCVYCTANSGTAPSDVTLGDFTVDIWQVYYDQLPLTAEGGPILPIMDLQTIYDIKQTAFQQPVQGQDNPYAFSNYRDFLATCLYFVNRSDTVGCFATEADITYLSMVAANYTEVFKVPPRVASTWARTTIGLDFPRGGFYIPTRARPISTIQYGNIDIVMNPAAVQSGSFVLAGYESLALTNFVGQAASLAPGG